VPRENAKIELAESDEVFDEDDARAMSPRRSSQDLEKMSQDARTQLNEFVAPLFALNDVQNLPLVLDFLLTMRHEQACQGLAEIAAGNFQPY
jgi:hypothetical protein